ncbi:MAG: hypothetical protein KKE65_05920, partial [Actinobacteria bacterium]|nr:hypothetical protein [Actinomycetota bacterium]
RKKTIGKNDGRHDPDKKVMELLREYPTLEHELVAAVHENGHEIVDEYEVESMNTEALEGMAEQRVENDFKRWSQGRAQFIQSMIEQGILQWGPAMRRDGDDEP